MDTHLPGRPGIALDPQQVRAVLPHRPPMLLVDDVVELVPGASIEARRRIRADDGFLQGHFPGAPVVPGVILIEALAQAAGLLAAAGREALPAGLLPVLMNVSDARFRCPVMAGDLVTLRVRLRHQRVDACRFDGTAWVGDKPVAEVTLMAGMVPRSRLAAALPPIDSNLVPAS